MESSRPEDKRNMRIGLQGHLVVLAAIIMLLMGLTMALIGYRLVVDNTDSDIRDKVDDLTNLIKSDIVRLVQQPAQPPPDIPVQGVFPDPGALEEHLQRELPTPGAHLALFRPDGALIAGAKGHLAGGDTRSVRSVADMAPIMRQGVQAYLHGQRGHGIEFVQDGKTWEVSLEEFTSNGKVTEVMVLAIPKADLLSAGMVFLRYSLLGMGGIFILCVPLVWLISRRISRPLRALTAKASAMHEFVLAGQSDVQSGVSEIQALAGRMQELQGDVREMLAITKAINSERDFEVLLQRVLGEMLSVAKADGGIVALLDEEEKIVLDQGSVCWIINGEKRIRPFIRQQDTPDMTMISYRALAQDKVMQATISRDDPRSILENLAPGFADPEVREVAALCVPLRDHMGEHIGMLILFKTIKRGPSGFQEDEVSFIEAFAATAAIALENQRLIKGHTQLRDALIHILAGAIDAKSPYTGGHCQRVPVIFQMLLEAACEADDGPLKDFVLDENGWEEAKLAAWLHDCGKVTTPEYVMDKATKLETMYDRIHEIRTRFEVLKRDVEIAVLRAELGNDISEAARQKLAEEWRVLEEEFAFVAACNIGGEFMDDEALERLATIGRRTWQRTLDKRLGVSRDELARMDSAGASAPPALETLLMDSPEHIIARGEQDTLAPDNSWGFRLNPPPVLYNRGEVYNLSIRRGTLTEEERYKINDHITRTIMMLADMPLPRHLRNMPEIAGAHHETMDGRGYPRKLKREDMSWGARMMAVADIFEALTAWDRPYKSGNPGNYGQVQRTESH